MKNDNLELTCCKPLKGTRVIVKRYNGCIDDKKCTLMVESARGCDRLHLEMGFNRYVAVVVDGNVKRSTMTRDLFNRIMQLI